MMTNQKIAAWMDPVIECVFPKNSKLISIKNFNILFLAPVCAPTNANYKIKDESKRQAGRNKTAKDPDTVFRQQIELIGKYSTKAASLEPKALFTEELPLKEGLALYTNKLFEDSGKSALLIQADTDYCQKKNNMSPIAFLSLFERCSGWKDSNVTALIKLYQKIFEGIFYTDPDHLARRIGILQRKCCQDYAEMRELNHRLPAKPPFDCESYPETELYEKSAEVFLFGLILSAANQARSPIIYQLSGVADSRTLPPPQNINVTVDFFDKMCIDALKGEEIWSIEKIRKLDTLLKKRDPNTIPDELLALFLKKISDFANLQLRISSEEYVIELIKLKKYYESIAVDSASNVVFKQ